MDVVTDESTGSPTSLDMSTLSDVTLHAQKLDLNDLHTCSSLHFPTENNPLSIDEIPIPDTEIGLDDILPSESFSTQVTPTTSLIDGQVPRKPHISIFQPQDLPGSTTQATEPAAEEKETGLPSPPRTPVRVVDRAADDVPVKWSDVESTPPLVAAGFVGDEIPRVDPLDSDGEWFEMPGTEGMRTLQAFRRFTEQDATVSGFGEDKKTKQRKKKSKGVRSQPPLHIYVSFLLDFIVCVG